MRLILITFYEYINDKMFTSAVSENGSGSNHSDFHDRFKSKIDRKKIKLIKKSVKKISMYSLIDDNLPKKKKLKNPSKENKKIDRI